MYKIIVHMKTTSSFSAISSTQKTDYQPYWYNRPTSAFLLSRYCLLIISFILLIGSFSPLQATGLTNNNNPSYNQSEDPFFQENLELVFLQEQIRQKQTNLLTSIFVGLIFFYIALYVFYNQVKKKNEQLLYQQEQINSQKLLLQKLKESLLIQTAKIN